MKEYLLRSLMFVPGHNEKLLHRAEKTDADALLLDLEDSVQPFNNKEFARKMIKEKITQGYFAKHLVFPRINDIESGLLLKDLQELTIQGVDGFMYPKSETRQDIYFIDRLLQTIEYEKKIEGTFTLIPLIETTAAVLNIQEIIKASKRIIAVAFGCEDFISDLEGIHDKEGQSIFTARAMIAMAARANKVVPIDTVHIDVHNLEDLEKNLILSKKLGFEGMLVLHPKELPLVHKYFSYSEEQIKNAKEMIHLSREAEKQGKGVAIINGKFIGPPMINTARKILKKNDLIQKKTSSRMRMF